MPYVFEGSRHIESYVSEQCIARSEPAELEKLRATLRDLSAETLLSESDSSAAPIRFAELVAIHADGLKSDGRADEAEIFAIMDLCFGAYAPVADEPA